MNFPSLEHFFGTVEDIFDPDKAGRVKVRTIPYHADSAITTEMLPWYQTGVSNSSGVGGNGNSPTGYDIGSVVFGFYLDPAKQTGIVICAINGFPDGASDVNGLSRGSDHPLVEKRAEANNKTAEEPAYAPASQYPYNDVYQGKGGIIREYDNTPSKERINIWHPSGTYDEIIANGNRAIKIVGDGYEFVVKNKKVFVGGDVSITVNGNSTIYTKGNCNQQVDGNFNQVVQGDYGLWVQGKIVVEAESELKIKTENALTMSSQGIMNVESYDVTNINGTSVLINGA